MRAVRQELDYGEAAASRSWGARLRGFAGRDFQAFVHDELGAHLVRPARKDEPARHGTLARSRSGSKPSSTPSKAGSPSKNTPDEPWPGLRTGRRPALGPGNRHLAQLADGSPGQALRDRR